MIDRLHQVTDELLTVLKNEVPEVPFIERAGVSYPKTMEGTVVFGKISFDETAKYETTARVAYEIDILNPDASTTKDNPRFIEALGLKVQQVLSANADLNGVIDNGRVTEMAFGSAPGRTDIGMVAISYQAEFGMEDEE